MAARDELSRYCFKLILKYERTVKESVFAEVEMGLTVVN